MKEELVGKATPMEMKIWGVRGASPVPDRRFLQYGGNTSCISLHHGGNTLCFDAGSGLVNLLPQLTETRLDILISHVHIDHIMGLFALGYLQSPEFEIHLYGEGRQGVSFRKQLETLFGSPYWPLGLQDITARLFIHEISQGEQFSIPGWQGAPRVSTLRGNHPGGSLLYGLELGGLRITYALDCEMEGKMFARMEEFARGSRLLIWDANFTLEGFRQGWGHSTWQEGLELAHAAGVGQILMTHYSRDYTDDFLYEQELLAKKADSRCCFAKEGMTIKL